MEDNAECMLVLIGATTEGKKELVGSRLAFGNAIARAPELRHAADPQALALGGGDLSRMRSEVTSRSNWANDSSPV